MVSKTAKGLRLLALELLFLTAAATGQSRNDLIFLLAKNPYKPAAAAGPGLPLRAADVGLYRPAASLVIDFYQSYVSTQDENTCVFTLSCSSFSRKAVTEYGLVHGLLMSADRLLRCHPLARRYYPFDAGSKLLVDRPVDRYHWGGPKNR